MLSYTSSPKLVRLTRGLVALWMLVLLVAYFWPQQALLRRMELASVDWRFHVRGPQQPDPRLAIVAVDDQSIRELGRWPWPRDRTAELLSRLQELGADRVVFDIFFVEHDDSASGADRDAALVAATRRFGAVYHAGFAYNPAPGEAPAALSEPVQGRAWDLQRVHTPRGLAAAGELYHPGSLVMPIPELTEAARAIGFMNVPESADGVFREIWPLLQYRGQFFPSLVLAVACDMLSVAPDAVEVTPGVSIKLGDNSAIPLDAEGRMMINFAGGHLTYPRVSAVELMQSRPDAPLAAQLAGKTVVVGVTASGLEDLRPSPFDTVYNGVETQANALDTILNAKHLRRLEPVYTGLVVIALAAVFGLWLLRTSTAFVCIGSAVIGGGHVWAGVWLFEHRLVLTDLVTPSLATAGFFVVLLLVRLFGEEQRRRVAQQTLAVFIPPQLADRLVTEEAMDSMRGQRRVITALFADLRGFTSASETVAPEDTVALLNRYFSFMHDIIWRNEGTLDKYIGDEIMVFFNAPVSQPDHASRAVRTALEMQRQIDERRDEWTYLGMPDLAAGIGISTGLALIGYVGSEARMQYTAIGHHVNLASRLQQLTRELNQRILISEMTRGELGDEFELQPQGEFELRGVGERIQIYSVLGPKGRPDYLETR